jgi:hypothetical protein
LLDVIKENLPDGLSQNVLEHYGMTRPDGTFSKDAKYSRVTFKDEYGLEHSFQYQNTPKEGRDVLCGLLHRGKKQRMEGKDRRSLNKEY